LGDSGDTIIVGVDGTERSRDALALGELPEIDGEVPTEAVFSAGGAVQALELAAERLDCSSWAHAGTVRFAPSCWAACRGS
jgi:hypothetical protein